MSELMNNSQQEVAATVPTRDLLWNAPTLRRFSTERAQLGHTPDGNDLSSYSS